MLESINMVELNKKLGKKTKKLIGVNSSGDWVGKINSEDFFKTLEELNSSSVSATITRDEQKRNINEKDK